MSKALEMLSVARLSIMALRMDTRAKQKELAEAMDHSSEWVQQGVHPQKPVKGWVPRHDLDREVAWVYDSMGVPVPVTKREVMMMGRAPNGEAIQRRADELATEISERIQVNCAWDDNFNFLLNKDIEVDLIQDEASVEMGWKDEAKIKSLEMGMRDIKAVDKRELSKYAIVNLQWEYKALLDEWKKANRKYSDIGAAIDKKIAATRYNEVTVELWGDTRDEFKAVNYLVHFVPKWTEDYGYQMEYIKSMEWDLSQTSDDEDDRMRYYWPADYNEACEQMDLLRPKMSKMLIKAKKRIFECKKNWSYDLYVKGMLIVLKEISEKLNADIPLYEKFLSMKFQLESVNGSSVREESVASMSLSIEDAIDMKRTAEKLSLRHNVSVQEAFLMIQANAEGFNVDQHVFLVEMAKEDIQTIEELEYI